MSLKRLSKGAIERFEKKHSQKAARILSALGKAQPFNEAIETEIGQELLKDAIIRMNEIVELIVEEKSTENDRAEFRALKRVTLAWSSKIETYRKNLDEVMK